MPVLGCVIVHTLYLSIYGFGDNQLSAFANAF